MQNPLLVILSIALVAFGIVLVFSAIHIKGTGTKVLATIIGILVIILFTVTGTNYYFCGSPRSASQIKNNSVIYIESGNVRTGYIIKTLDGNYRYLFSSKILDNSKWYSISGNSLVAVE